MHPGLVALQAACVGVQTGLVVWEPSPITIGGLVFVALLFVASFVSRRSGARR